jgi:hypothetical protein
MSEKKRKDILFIIKMFLGWVSTKLCHLSYRKGHVPIIRYNSEPIMLW